ncbi:hypothetical protein EDD85DRAFT_798473, partial [Armillaria nabsnona]
MTPSHGLLSPPASSSSRIPIASWWRRASFVPSLQEGHTACDHSSISFPQLYLYWQSDPPLSKHPKNLRSSPPRLYVCWDKEISLAVEDVVLNCDASDSTLSTAACQQVVMTKLAEDSVIDSQAEVTHMSAPSVQPTISDLDVASGGTALGRLLGKALWSWKHSETENYLLSLPETYVPVHVDGFYTLQQTVDAEAIEDGYTTETIKTTVYLPQSRRHPNPDESRSPNCCNDDPEEKKADEIKQSITDSHRFEEERTGNFVRERTH